VKSYYKVLYSPIQFSFPWKSIWKVKIPLRVVFFVWLATLRKILTLNNLRQRNIIAIEWCYMCKSCGESIDNLFLHCMVATKLWNTILQMFGVVWVMLTDVGELEVAKGQPVVDANLANGSVVFDVVFMEGTECT